MSNASDSELSISFSRLQGPQSRSRQKPGKSRRVPFRRTSLSVYDAWLESYCISNAICSVVVLNDQVVVSDGSGPLTHCASSDGLGWLHFFWAIAWAETRRS